MGFTVIMIDDIVLKNMARCPHINRAPIYNRYYDKKIYSLYLCLAKHLVTELSIFWLGNGVEIRIFFIPSKFLKFLTVLRYDCLVLCFNKDIAFKSVMSS